MKLNRLANEIRYINNARRSLLSSCAATVFAVAGLSVGVSAQEASQVSASPEDEFARLEEVVVTGYRSSLEDALNAKRNAGNIIDSIKAEDIGKSTDQNIAEALQRVTGVAINRSDGEGTTIVARGAPAELNGVTLNGVPLTSGGASGAVDLSQYSADVLSSIEVVKTPSAKQDEGSLGAAIELKSFSPLDSKKNRRVFEVQGRYNDLVDGDITDDRKLGVSLSQKFNEDRLGVSLVLISETNTTRKDSIGIGQGYPSYDASRFGGGAINAQTGEFITQFDYGDGNGLQDIIALMPQQIEYQTNLIEQERDTITATIQFQPDDTSNMKLDVSYATQDINRRQNEFSMISNPANRGSADPALQDSLVFDPNTFTLVRNVHVAQGANNNNRENIVQFTDLKYNTEQETTTISGLYEKTVGDFDFSLRGGHAETKLDTPLRLFSRFRNPRERSTGNAMGYDCGSSPSLCQIVLPDGYLADATNFIYNTGNLAEQFGEDTSDSVYFDVVWNKEFGPIKSIEAGVKWSNREKNFNDSNQGFNVAQTDDVLTQNGFTLDDFTTGSTPSDFGSDLGLPRDQITDGWNQLDGQKVLDTLNSLGQTPAIKLNLRNTRDLEQEIFASYVQANFEFNSGIVFGDIGVRVAETDTTSTGFSGYDYFTRDSFINNNNIAFFGSEEAAIAALGRDTLEGVPPTFPDPSITVVNNKYDNLLPSLNVNWAFRDNMMLRFAMSKTMARPPIDSLRAGYVIIEDTFNAQSRVSFGEPGLNPYKSTNIDISYEWYFDEASLFSVALFNKDLTDFAEDISFFSYYRDFRDEFYDVDGNLLPQEQINFVGNAETALLPLEGGPNQPGCHPNRELDMSAAEGQPGCDLLLVTKSRNGTGGFVRGVEVALQHNTTYLPGILGDMGFVFNYTYSDSQADEETNDAGEVLFPETPLLETSEHTYNATLFYETDAMLIRLAYNYRSEYLLNRNTRNGHADWRDDFDSLDLSGSYNINKQLSVNFQLQNLLDSESREYVTVGQETNGVIPAEPYDFGGIQSRTSSLSNTGMIMRAGLRYSF